jgi:hypothetical protein
MTDALSVFRATTGFCPRLLRALWSRDPVESDRGSNFLF